MHFPNPKNLFHHVSQSNRAKENILGLFGLAVVIGVVAWLYTAAIHKGPLVKIGSLSRSGQYEQLAKTHPRGEEFLGYVNKGYDKLENDDPLDDEGAYLDIAFYRDQLGDHKGAIEVYKKGVAKFSTNEVMLGNLAHVYENIKDYQNAEIWYKKVIEVNPHNVRLILDLANLYRFYMPEKKDQILPLVEQKALVDNPNDGNLIIYLATYYRNDLKDRNKAVEYYQKAIALNPNDPSLQIELKNLLLQK